MGRMKLKPHRPLKRQWKIIQALAAVENWTVEKRANGSVWLFNNVGGTFGHDEFTVYHPAHAIKFLQELGT